MEEAVWQTSSPREKLLVSGLTDWVELGQVHSFVAAANPSASLTAIQAETLDLVRALADEGLVLIGDLAGSDHRFAAWDTPLADSLQRIRNEYVDRYDDENSWPWYCWLDLTAEGDRVARAVEAKLSQST